MIRITMSDWLITPLLPDQAIICLEIMGPQDRTDPIRFGHVSVPLGEGEAEADSEDWRKMEQLAHAKWDGLIGPAMVEEWLGSLPWPPAPDDLGYAPVEAGELTEGQP